MTDLLKAADAMAEAVRKYLDGDYEGPHQHDHRHPTLKWKCEHGIPNTDACEVCIGAHFAPALAAYEAARREAIANYTMTISSWPVPKSEPNLKPSTLHTYALSGDACRTCGNFSLIRTGKCQTCQACGATDGCA